MSRKTPHVQIFQVAFANCYLSDDRPRSANKPGKSESIPHLSFHDDLYQEPGPSDEARLTPKFKAAKVICDYLQDGPTALDFWKLFKKLPVEVRNKIYKLLMFAWSPDTQWARLSRNGRRFSVSRRLPTQRPLPPIHYLTNDDPLGITREDLRQWSRQKNWEQSEGRLDFFKLNEYRSIQKLIWFMEKIEYAMQLDDAGSENQVVKTKGKGKKVQKTDDDAEIEYINLWKEVVAFFWDNVIIDFGERLHYGTIALKQSSRYSKEHHKQCSTKDGHEEVKHICLHLDTIWHSDDHTIETPRSDHCELCRFLLLCEFIAEHFQKVETLLLYLSLPTDALVYLIHNEDDVARDVMEALRALKVSKEFDPRLRVVNPGDWREDSDVPPVSERVLDQWSASARPWFLQRWSPVTVLEYQRAKPRSLVPDSVEEEAESSSAQRTTRRGRELTRTIRH